MSKGEVVALQAQYRAVALEWQAAADKPHKANRILGRHHAISKVLKETEPGRKAISELVNDPETVVRLLAATDSLAWDGPSSEEILAEIERADQSIYAVDAKWTLRSYQDGTLDLDW